MKITNVGPTTVTFRSGEHSFNEREFEAIIRAYILNEKTMPRAGAYPFAHGGIVNLCSVISSVCNKLAEEGGEYYDEAERSFDSAAAALDLPYKTPDEVALRNG